MVCILQNDTQEKKTCLVNHNYDVKSHNYEIKFKVMRYKVLIFISL